MGSEEEIKQQERNSHHGKDDPLEMRPSASSGWWLGSLLPIAYLVNCWKHERSLTFEYKFSAIIAFGLGLQVAVICLALKVRRRIYRAALYLIPAVATATLIFHFLSQGIVFSTFNGFVSTITFNGLFFYILRRLSKSFTYGEASVVVQGTVIFLANLFIKLVSVVQKTTVCVQQTGSIFCVMYPHELPYTQWTLDNYKAPTEIEKMTTILQIGLLGVIFIVGCCNFMKLFRGLFFYVLLAFVGLVVMLFPVGEEVAVLTLWNFLTNDLQKLCIITLYMGLIGVTVVTVNWQMNRSEKSNTRTRKIFHILIVFVFVPGLIYQCTFLFVASGIALALLIVLETMRVIRLAPVYEVLEEAVRSFIDEKDAGLIALTPIYLLVGCSTPIWLHSCPCDLTDSAGFELIPLMAGVISVGIGDTAASIVGSKFGRHKWPIKDCIKTIEGTIAGVLSQALVLPLLIYLGFVQSTVYLAGKFVFAVTAASVIETFTDQVDNLVLPLVTYILLSL